MTTRLYIIVALATLLAPSTLLGRNRLRTIDDLNNTPHALNSHAGVEQFSSLEADRTSYRLISKEELNISGTPTYSRIKRLNNGEWLLLFQGHKIGSYIYYCISKDLKEWSYRKALFTPYPVTHSQGEDQRRFSTADAVVLQNGDIIVVCSYRANKGYRKSIDCGIMMRRSSDNGATWSNEEIIYKGTNWEPYLLLLPDGRIQCYFTDCNPATRNSGTSIITSSDNGKSWSEKQIVCRQHRCTLDNGTRIYSDQMPSFRLLNDGKTLLGFLEANTSNLATGEKSHYRMSVIRQHGVDWTPLTGDEVGPSDRDSNIIRGAGGYVETFPSGETILSCNIHSRFSLKVGNHTGTEFNGQAWDKDWLRPLPKGGYWGSTERIDSHRILATMHCKEGIQIITLHLNHRITAPRKSVKIDGKSHEWQHDEALFIGSDSPSQMVLRAAHDKENLYLLLECNNKDSAVKLRIGELPQLHISTKGYKGDGIRVKCRKAESDKKERGFIAEVAVPLEKIATERDGDIALWAALIGNDSQDSFSHSSELNRTTWQRIAIE